ncbi:MAG: gamma-glutamyltransferase [Alphaproteobacteria bacterium]
MADEPRAAVVARDVLTAGGRAADAAIAAYFTMAVTMPSAASLGGGGACVMHDFFEKRDEAVVFLPTLARGDATLGVVPGNVRGLFALHARYGRLPWADLLLPGELLARDGHAISRAFARDLARDAARLAADPAAAAIFSIAGGRAPAEGTVVRQVELAAVLSALRTRGPGDLYVGQLATRYAEAATTVGWRLTPEDMRDYVPVLGPPAQQADDNDMLIAAPAPTGGPAALAAWRSGGGTVAASAGPAAGASVVALDRDGQMVACSFTLGRAFGQARMARGLGILLPGTDVVNAADTLVVAMRVNVPTQRGYVAVAGSRNGSVAAVGRLLRDAERDDINLAPTVAAITSGTAEGGGPHLQAIQCAMGVPRVQPRCAFETDPTGFGLAVMADR